MFWLRACTRCQGDLYLEPSEHEGEELYCMQCGFRWFGPADSVMLPVVSAQPETRAEARAA